MSVREKTVDQVLLFMDEGHSGIRSVEGKPSKIAAKCRIFRAVCVPTWMINRNQEGE
jgi:hypothetical protein